TDQGFQLVLFDVAPHHRAHVHRSSVADVHLVDSGAAGAEDRPASVEYPGEVLGAEADEAVLHEASEPVPEPDQLHVVGSGGGFADGADGGVEPGGVAAGGEDSDGARHRTPMVLARLFPDEARQAAAGTSPQVASGPSQTTVNPMPASRRAASATSRASSVMAGNSVTFMPENLPGGCDEFQGLRRADGAVPPGTPCRLPPGRRCRVWRRSRTPAPRPRVRRSASRSPRRRRRALRPAHGDRDRKRTGTDADPRRTGGASRSSRQG